MESHPNATPAVWAGRPAWSTYIWLWIFVTIFAARGVVFLWMGYWSSAAFHGIVIGMLTALAVFLRETMHYRVTREAVYRSKGILGKAEQPYPLSTIETVSKEQGPLERMFGSGNVILHLKTGIRERLSGVKDPDVVCNKIRAML
jgi:membrane protein YdbS with pleckstrin-like domain